MADHPIVVKQLKSYEPDLDVVVGPGQQVFRYHGAILASYSAYIDTMLSTPMREQDTMRITFPDIEPDVWTKLIKFLETGGSREMQLTDVIELLPIYDQYDFQGAVKMCDISIHGMLETWYSGDREFHSLLTSAANLSYELDLPLSKKKAVDFAKKIFSISTDYHFEERHFRDVLPLIQNEESTLEYIVCTILGKGAMGIDEMRNVINEECFVEDYKTRCGQIYDQQDIMMQAPVSKIAVSGAGVEVNGEYELATVDGKPGVMSRMYVNHTTEMRAVVHANDPFGKVWNLSCSTNARNRPPLEPGFCTVLYRWESDFGSIVPPRHGWSAIEGELSIPDFHFMFDHGDYESESQPTDNHSHH